MADTAAPEPPALLRPGIKPRPGTPPTKRAVAEQPPAPLGAVQQQAIWGGRRARGGRGAAHQGYRVLAVRGDDHPTGGAVSRVAGPMCCRRDWTGSKTHA